MSDPILRRAREASIGWYLLGDDEFQPVLDRLVRQLIRKHALDAVVWHGTSAGGYAAVRYCARSQAPGIALAVAPQNDPTIFDYWAEYQQFTIAGASAFPQLLEDAIAGANRGQFFYIVTSDGDSYHLYYHVGPLLKALMGRDNVYFSLLRNGREHGRISHSDYWASCGDAVRRYERVSRRSVDRSSRPAERSEGCRFGGGM